MAKTKRYYRHMVIAVGDNFKDRLEVESTVIDTWHGRSHSYRTINLDAEADELPLELAYTVVLIG